MSLASCCGLPMIRKSVLEEFRARRFAAIQLEIEEKVDCSDDASSVKR